MTKKEVAQICVLIRKTTFAWKNETDEEFMQIIDFWYELLSDMPYEMARKASADYIRDNKYPPTVADIRKPYREWKESQADLKREYNQVYYSAIAVYPCYKDSREERIEFDRITGNSVSKARKLARQIEDYVRDKETNHGCLPTLINYLKGLEKIE